MMLKGNNVGHPVFHVVSSCHVADYHIKYTGSVSEKSSLLCHSLAQIGTPSKELQNCQHTV